MTDKLARAVIAVVALGLFGVSLRWPNFRIDLTKVALIVIAVLAIFGPKVRLKALELFGFKVEFESAPTPSTAGGAQASTPEVEFKRASTPSTSVSPDNYVALRIKLVPVEIIVTYLPSTRCYCRAEQQCCTAR